ncbi:MAG: Unknown protein [uncultured Thiotrichaceae bacterium]|uniref:DUF4390 domain-containing protein n=1 Tax=uncultured Thiotrichaceae bacterium TaxID=298394 RepID=A0A6S6TU94_9GAMM|nr:MAG: Unknown protein [uncultured Thiotrichaceae bacterium]
MKMIIKSFFKSRSAWLLLGLMWAALLFPVTAAVAEERITVHDFVLYDGDSREQLVASVRFDYHLTKYLRDSLRNGITLRSETRFDLMWHSDWWWNKTQTLDRVVSELKYHALTGQYQLVNKTTNANWNFSNLATALQQLGRLDKYKLPALPESAFTGDAAIYIESRLEPRASESLGVSAKLAALFSNEKHELISQGVMWPLTP